MSIFVRHCGAKVNDSKKFFSFLWSLNIWGLWEDVQTGIKYKVPIMCYKEKHSRVKVV